MFSVIIAIFVLKEPGESINKDLKSFQLFHSPQIGPVERLTATFDRIMDRSDPEVLRNFNKAFQQRDYSYISKTFFLDIFLAHRKF